MDTSILEIRDENGKGYDVVKYEDLLLPNFFRTIAAVEKKLSAIKQLEYKEGDVFLCGYPKCVINGSYFDYLNAWAEILKSRHSQNILVIYYEDLVQDCFMQLKKIQGFLGTGKSDFQLQQIVSRCSIDRLRSDVNKGHVRTLLVNDEGESHLYRKGKVGDWKSHFTIDQNTVFDRQIELQLKDCLFQFQYESNDIPSKL